MSLLSKARENFKCAELATAANLSNSTMSRLYYSIFQAAQVVLTRNNIRPETIPFPTRNGLMPSNSWNHTNVPIAIRKVGRLPRDLSDALRTARSLREKADYFPDDVESDEISPLMKPTKEMLNLAGNPT